LYLVWPITQGLSNIGRLNIGYLVGAKEFVDAKLLYEFNLFIPVIVGVLEIILILFFKCYIAGIYTTIPGLQEKIEL